jgi:excisionase family DNA binding protein
VADFRDGRFEVTMERDNYLTPSEVGAILGIHRVTVKRLIKRGELQAIRVGTRGDYRVSRAELDRYIEGNQT